MPDSADPPFTWDIEQLAHPLAAVRFKQGRFAGIMSQLSDQQRKKKSIARVQSLREPLYIDQLLGDHAIRCHDAQAQLREPVEHTSAQLQQLLDWFNYGHETDGVVRAAAAYFWFLALRPFEDGNCRIASLIADHMLAQVEHDAMRFYTISAQIATELHACNEARMHAVKTACGDATPAITWFLELLSRALDIAEKHLRFTLRHAAFWRKHQSFAFSTRQLEIIERTFAEGKAHITTEEWSQLAQSSLTSAQRDIKALTTHNVLHPGPSGGRNTHYSMRF